MAEISKTADQALAVLQEVAERGPVSSADLARALGLNRTVVHRLLSTLHQRGFVVRDDAGYRAGALLVRLAAHVQPELRAAGRRTMRALADRVSETVVLHIPDGDEAVVLDQVVASGHVLRVQHEIGSRHPMVLGASGRAILAFMNSRFIERALRRIDNTELVSRQLEGVRQLGYALSHDELQQGVHGLAVPVSEGGVVVGSMAILAPPARAGDLLQHLGALNDSAGQLSAALDASAKRTAA